MLMTLQLGEFESVEKLHDNDMEEDQETGSSSMAAGGLSIPDAKLPAPPPPAFCDLPMLDQVAYTLPVLRCVFENNYGPAKERNDAFLKGGYQRARLSKIAPPKGSLTRREYEELGQIVKSWALGLNDSLCLPSATLGINDHQSTKKEGPSSVMPHEDQQAPSQRKSVSENRISTVSERDRTPTLPKCGLSMTLASNQVSTLSGMYAYNV